MQRLLRKVCPILADLLGAGLDVSSRQCPEQSRTQSRSAQKLPRPRDSIFDSAFWRKALRFRIGMFLLILTVLSRDCNRGYLLFVSIRGNTKFRSPCEP